MFFKIGFLKISQYSQEKTCVGASFKKVAGLKKETRTQVFSCDFLKFLRTGFL